MLMLLLVPVAGAQKVLPYAIPIMLSSCASDDPNLRQCAVYGLGVIAQHRPEAFRPVATEAIAAIMRMLSSHHAKCALPSTD